MSMLDAFFNRGGMGFFKAARCKTLLKLTVPRIKLLRNRREAQIRQLRRDVAKLLETGQEATARIRVEHIIREENMMAAQEIIELFCELIAVRLPIIESQRECPLDLKEAISSICFAAPRCSDLPELQQVQMQFAGKYGKEFITAATELLPDCGVNRQIIELLSIRAPSVEVKMKLLKEIAEEHEIDWDPDSTRAEFLKPHEDLLNGPGHFIGGSSLPLPREKSGDSISYTPDVTRKDCKPVPEVDTGLDSLDLPEVPKVSPYPSHVNPEGTDNINPHTGPVSEVFPTMPTPPQSVKAVLDVESNPDAFLESSVVKSATSTSTSPNVIVVKEDKQFVPFVSPPPSTTFSTSPKSHETPISFSEPSLSVPRTRSDTKVYLNDVLAAAHTAAETAERAAAAARAAASLAEVRISELEMKDNGQVSKNGKEMSKDSSDVIERKEFDQQLSHENSTLFISTEKLCEEPGSPVAFDNEFARQPSRSTSLEDDPYFSYPNLFGRHDSNVRSDIGK